MLRSLIFLVMLSFTSAVQAQGITVFAAASLKSVLDELGSEFTAKSGLDVNFVFAGSSTLARQILQGAPADIFISANAEWMRVLQTEGVLIEQDPRDLVSNKLVLITSLEGIEPVSESNREQIAHVLAQGDGQIALAMVDAVPAGIYGKQALSALGLWDQLSKDVIQSENVRSALGYVALGEAQFGIVYATDALAEPRVSVVAEFAPNLHDPIRYPVARIVGGQDGNAAEFLEFLQTQTALDTFTDFGFVPFSGD